MISCVVLHKSLVVSHAMTADLTALQIRILAIQPSDFNTYRCDTHVSSHYEFCRFVMEETFRNGPRHLEWTVATFPRMRLEIMRRFADHHPFSFFDFASPSNPADRVAAVEMFGRQIVNGGCSVRFLMSVMQHANRRGFLASKLALSAVYLHGGGWIFRDMFKQSYIMLMLIIASRRLGILHLPSELWHHYTSIYIPSFQHTDIDAYCRFLTRDYYDWPVFEKKILKLQKAAQRNTNGCSV